MRIAVSYENGTIFQHFGHTEQFKLYDVEDGKIAAEQIVNTNGSGHGALAGFLKAAKADVLICGGIGGGAQTALQEQGIELCAGASGNADAAVQAYLRGELINTGANCDHHDHHGEGHECGDHGCGEHDCGGHDGGCGGCHSPRMEGPNVGKKVRTHYRGTFNDGTQFDSSYDRGEPLEFVCGAGMMIPGFDKAVADMKVGEIRKVHLMPEEAYGVRDLGNVFTLEIQQLPGSQDLNVGERAYLQTMDGRPFEVQVIAKDDKNITLDANHEMAGKELNFEIELVEVL
ncbi:MAG: FKBP-type peptidyl-prolyl cis-trans isomerase [Firmicutes bacterium]|nr:FKBP-type peptidyl-prolyl cis-trans isomerase [Bacillota bacterium]